MNPELNYDGIRILVVEDDPNLRMLLHDYLELMKFSVETASDGEEALTMAHANIFDLYILDVMLPRMDGFTLAGKLREKDSGTPIVFLTAKSMLDDRITGFMQGCDDYITKPFDTDELFARIKAILKRCSRNKLNTLTEEGWYAIGTFTFDFDNLLLSSPTVKINLTRKEASLLRLLCNNRNQLVLRETAQKVVWGESDYFVSRSMDVFIARLRKYLKDDPSVAITNVHGMGFMLQVYGSGQS
ncbi:MAG TPA: response regulator transcription factor [Bacteroidales bacterium]|nr:response regulator transcription factor [Bacteroidales bacterium]